jgi:hypothetical protein
MLRNRSYPTTARPWDAQGIPPGKKGGASGNKVAEPIPLEEAWGGCVAAGVRMAAGGLVGEWSRCGERSCLTTVGLVATLPEEVG